VGRRDAGAIITLMSIDLKTIHNLILDMDGVLWHGDRPLPGLVALFQTLDELDIGYVLATNNATKVADQYSAKLARFGVAVPPEQIMTSAEVTASYLAHYYSRGSRVYVVGEEGLRQALLARGFEIVVADGLVAPGTHADLVVVGLDRHACWEQLASASYLIHHGARFVGTNGDVTFPTEVGPLPGAGSLLAMVEAATGVSPEIMGKPAPAVFEEALQRLGGTVTNTAMVGDRLDTDIAGAQQAGLPAILLLSGVTHCDQLASQAIQADLVFADIRELAQALRMARKEIVSDRTS
jgi:4-nitrophenyl phosphatase